MSKECDTEKIDFSHPVAIFSQTTQDPAKYETILEAIRSRMKDKSLITVNNTICRQVSNRAEELKVFARKHDVIVFVSGVKSSNGRALYDICLSKNPRTYFVSTPEEIRSDFFVKAETVGICGATSTPRWLMEKIAEVIKNI